VNNAKDAALEALRNSTSRYNKTEAAHEAARTETIYLVIEALRAGCRPTDVVDQSPFKDAYVRRLARKNGIKPSRKATEADANPAPQPQPQLQGDSA
jgi:hypothetical protein